ncbi:MAG: aminoacyl-histidine dipeptidase [Lachnospiraceae bacterium]|nr:aminoacyl-histidine dipeptidase [Lachnospiraceae bacterium]
MGEELKNLSPENVFEYFAAISKIPRGSGNTKGMTEYLLDFAAKRGLPAEADEIGNVIIKKGASEGYEEAETVILQGHVDMVCVSAPGVVHDFEKDPIHLIADGDYLMADGTTLGGDDGIAAAYMLAILSDDTVAHPNLECLFTVDEETGLAGASAFDFSKLKGRKLINIDSEKEGILTVGCAGGIRADVVLPIRRAVVKGMPVLVEIKGLLGGHSGADIGCGRINANKLMGRYLSELDGLAPLSLVDVFGGDKDNAIPAFARTHFVIDEDDLEKARTFTAEFSARVRKEYAGTDEGLAITLESGHTHKVKAMDADSQQKVILFLSQAADGVYHMSGTTPGLVQTSSNLGIMRTGDVQFVASSLIRSSVLSERDLIAEKFRELASFLGGRVLLRDGYPAWEYRQDSDLRELMVEVYKAMYEEEPKIEVIHAGLECGIFYGKEPSLDAVSIGPDMIGIHTPKEKLSVSSVGRVYDFLLSVLASMA